MARPLDVGAGSSGGSGPSRGWSSTKVDCPAVVTIATVGALHGYRRGADRRIEEQHREVADVDAFLMTVDSETGRASP